MSEGPIKNFVSVQFNIPRYIISEPGKQNRACTGNMRITPGVAEPFEFQYTNVDGVPINLSGFTLTLVFWYPQAQYESLAANMQSNVILAKNIAVDEVYSGKGTAFLTDQDTTVIAQGGRSSVRWSVYIYDKTQNNMFMTQITSNGERYGLCYLDSSDYPSAEIVKSLGITPNIVTAPVFVGPLVGAQATTQVGEIAITNTTHALVGLTDTQAASQLGVFTVT